MRKLIAPLFETEALGPIAVKGKVEPVPVYRVLRDTIARWDAARPPRTVKRGGRDGGGQGGYRRPSRERDSAAECT